MYEHVAATAYGAKLEEILERPEQVWPADRSLISDSDVETVATLDFFLFDYSDEQLLLLLEVIFDGMVEGKVDVDRAALRTFILTVRATYRAEVPFHNFKHAFAVTQQCYALLQLTGLVAAKHFDPMEPLALFVACLCHDIGHTGLNNTYQKNAGTPLAIRYNDHSVLESYHCACASEILALPSCDFLAARPDLKKRLRELMVPIILTTDVSMHKKHHGDLLDILRSGTAFEWSEPAHRLIVLRNFMMMSDLNNETRSFRHSQMWGPLVQEEFYRQGDVERQQGLPVLPMMERTARVEHEQQGFIKYLCLPLYETNSQLLPALQVCVANLRRNLESWAALE